MTGRAFDSMDKMAQAAKSQPITVAPTIQNYDMKPVADAISKMPVAQVIVQPSEVVFKPQISVEPTPITYNAPDITNTYNIDTTPIAKELRPLAGIRDVLANAILALAEAIRGQKAPTVNVMTPPAQVTVNNVMPDESIEEQRVIRDPGTRQITGTISSITHKYKKEDKS